MLILFLRVTGNFLDTYYLIWGLRLYIFQSWGYFFQLHPEHVFQSRWTTSSPTVHLECSFSIYPMGYATSMAQAQGPLLHFLIRCLCSNFSSSYSVLSQFAHLFPHQTGKSFRSGKCPIHHRWSRIWNIVTPQKEMYFGGWGGRMGRKQE